MKIISAETVEEIKDFGLNYGAESKCRIKSSLAKDLILNNVSTIKQGTVRYFEVRALGLSLFEVNLAPTSVKETKFLK